MKKTLLLIPALLVLMLVWAAPAHAGGSDDPTPYTVGLHGITLPAGDTFPAHGHVNIRMADGSTAGIHFDPNNGQPGGAWIGKSYIPWKAFGFKSTKVCVEWVQIHGYNEHFGEGGQAPVGKACKSVPAPDPTPTLEPSPEPSPTVTPEPEPTPEPEGEIHRHHGASSCVPGVEGLAVRSFGADTYVDGELVESKSWTEHVSDPGCTLPASDPQDDVAPPALPVEAEATFTG